MMEKVLNYLFPKKPISEDEEVKEAQKELDDLAIRLQLAEKYRKLLQ